MNANQLPNVSIPLSVEIGKLHKAVPISAPGLEHTSPCLF
jgi:hypothetical protein